LVGGPTLNSGHVFARNPRTGFYGPVCDDFFGDADVRQFELEKDLKFLKHFSYSFFTSLFFLIRQQLFVANLDIQD
jgi:hypothetical protein